MSIVEKIKEDQLAARKAGEASKAANLTYILGQLSQKKDTSDDGAIALIRAFVKSSKSEYKDVLPESVAYDIQVLEAYLPQELTDDEIYAFLDSARENGDKITKAYMGKINLFAKSQGKIVNNANASLIINAYL